MTPRVLHAPCVVGGNAGRLAAAERALGLASWCLTTDPNPFGYPVDEALRPLAQGRLGFEAQRWRLLSRALRDFDVVHFNFGRTFFPNALQLDLPILKAFGKALFMTFQGDDVRQGDHCRRLFDVTFASRVPPGYYTAASDAEKRRRVRRLDRYVDGMYALNPDLLHVLPSRARFLPYANVDLAVWRQESQPDNPVPVVVHAPTNRAVKGTELILEAAARLRAEGERFELVLVENMSNAEARALYQRADLAVDQLFAGWYGGFAVEMMALGKPVLCYLREGDFRFLPPGMAEQLPILNAGPAQVQDALRGALRLPRERRREIGARGRLYVDRWHDPAKVAAMVKRDYEAALARRAGR